MQIEILILRCGSCQEWNYLIVSDQELVTTGSGGYRDECLSKAFDYLVASGWLIGEKTNIIVIEKQEVEKCR